jgi:23S rRNA maturation mini-RNase III
MSTNSPIVKRWFKRFLIVIAILAVGLILSILVITPAPAETQSAAVFVENVDSLQRGRDADAARYNAMAEYYAAKEAAGLQRGREADAARYTAMAEYYAAKEAAGLQRGREADAARYTAMAEYYAAKEAVSLQRGRDADAARYNAMAEYYAAASKSK